VILVPGGPATPVHARDAKLLAWLRQAPDRQLDGLGVFGLGDLAAAGLFQDGAPRRTGSRFPR